eukprot:TRINITY_DN2345_c0_g1_i1.p1 TRINITY_DN2345_c0_g1~~TRINITY_DN2345_c0_g1_i1.p1  ORF type:complete len:426 (+),score=100.98 TRINITY_DN2345_c0_g1_i1:268-1545(+)
MVAVVAGSRVTVCCSCVSKASLAAKQTVTVTTGAPYPCAHASDLQRMERHYLYERHQEFGSRKKGSEWWQRTQVHAWAMAYASAFSDGGKWHHGTDGRVKPVFTGTEQQEHRVMRTSLCSNQQHLVTACASEMPIFVDEEGAGDRSIESSFQLLDEQDVLPDSDGNMEDNRNEEEENDPWVGAIMLQRSSLREEGEQGEIVFNTTLERLGLTSLSSAQTRKVCEKMGGFPWGEAGLGAATPVTIQFDVERDGRDLKLIGVVRTALAAKCNRCLDDMAEKVVADFDVLLLSSPIHEPTKRSLGVVLGKDKSLNKEDPLEMANDKEELDIDMDDKLYFPAEAWEMDLSKYLRDVIHLEIPFVATCSSECRGLCMGCGVNLNRHGCSCGSFREVMKGEGSTQGGGQQRGRWNVLEGLRKRLQDNQKEE